MTFYAKVIYIIVSLMLITGFVFTNGPKIENKYFRVANNTQITHFIPVENGVIIRLSFNKVRPCEYIPHIAWYVIDPISKRLSITKYEHIELENIPPPSGVTRPTGRQTVGPWKVYTIHRTREAFLKNVKAYVNHRCHPFWITSTRFYP